MTTTHDVPMPEPDVTVAIDTDGIPRSLQGRFYTADQLRAYADARCAKLQAIASEHRDGRLRALEDVAALRVERDALAEKVRSIAEHCRDIYAIVPRLPVDADTMDAATDALHTFCLMLGIEGIDIEPTNKKGAAIDAAGGDQC